MSKLSSLLLLVLVVAMLPAAAVAQKGPIADVVGDRSTEMSIPSGYPAGGILDPMLYDNGSFVTHPGGGYNGADASALQTALGMGTYGTGHQYVYSYWVADDFAIADASGWDLTALQFFAYQTGTYGYPPASTMTAVYYQILDGQPGAGGNVLCGDTVTNAMIATGWTNVYRVLDTSLADTARPVMEQSVSVWPDCAHLPAGTYWIMWSGTGSLGSGPWANPITILGQTVTGNALQSVDGGVTWNPVLDTGTSTPQGFPFRIFGTIPPPPEPDIDVTPASLLAEQCADTVTTQTLQICNSGGMDLTWSLTEQAVRKQAALVPEGKPIVPQGATTGRAVQPFKPVIDANPILLIVTTDVSASVQQALDQLGYLYDLYWDGSGDWTGLDFSPYSVVIAAMDGGAVTQASIQKARTDVLDAGKQLIFLGGTCYDQFALGVNAYLVGNDTGNYCWQVTGYPQWTVTDAGHPLAAGLPGSYDYVGYYNGYYQVRVTDPEIEQVAVNGESYPAFFAKQTYGSFVWYIDSMYSSYWTDPADFAFLVQVIANALAYNVTPPFDATWLSEAPTSGTVPAGGCQDVTVTFDSNGLAAGDYFASLAIASNDPDEPAVTVPVQLTVDACDVTMHVHMIKFHTRLNPYGATIAQWGVRIFDGDEQPLAEAAVTATMTGPTGNTLQQTRLTAARGWVQFHMGSHDTAPFQLCVDDVVKSGYLYVPGDNEVPGCSP